MAWSESQKASGRAELRRRLASETPATRRKALLIPAAAASMLAALAALGGYSVRAGQSGLMRLEGIFVFCACLAAMIVVVPLAYVRYLDWWRGRNAKP